MPERFYAPEMADSQLVKLEGAEAHHLQRVRRLAVGDAVELFDGLGACAIAEVSGLSRGAVELTVQERTAVVAIGRRTIDVATAIPKSDRFRWMVEKTTELGVRRLLPLRTARSVVHPGGGKFEKMRQTVVAACKQSGRNRLMEIEPTIDWKTLISEKFDGMGVVVAHPGGRPLLSCLSVLDADRPLLVVVGPEGGLTDEEVKQAVSAGAAMADLGQHILRIETAVIAAAAVCANPG